MTERSDHDHPDGTAAESPMRALDGVQPKGRWDDVLERADRPADLTPIGLPPRRRTAALLGAAAAVVALVALAAVLIVGGGDEGADIASGGGEGGGGSGTTWGTGALEGAWTLVAFEVDGEAVDLAAIDQEATLTFTGEGDGQLAGTIGLRWCNSGGGPADLELDDDGARLVVTEFAMTAMACMTGSPDAGGETASDLMQREEQLGRLMTERPTVELTEDGDVPLLTLSTGSKTATFARSGDLPPAPPAEPGGDPDAAVSSPANPEGETTWTAPDPVLPSVGNSEPERRWSEEGTAISSNGAFLRVWLQCGEAGGVRLMAESSVFGTEALTLRIGGEDGRGVPLGSITDHVEGLDPNAGDGTWVHHGPLARPGIDEVGELAELLRNGEVIATATVEPLPEGSICR